MLCIDSDLVTVRDSPSIIFVDQVPAEFSVLLSCGKPTALCVNVRYTITRSSRVKITVGVYSTGSAGVCVGGHKTDGRALSPPRRPTCGSVMYQTRGNLGLHSWMTHRERSRPLKLLDSPIERMPARTLPEPYTPSQRRENINHSTCHGLKLGFIEGERRFPDVQK